MMLEHRYGHGIYISNDSYLQSILAKLCHEQTIQPLVNQYVKMIYQSLIAMVIDQEFPKKKTKLKTRMAGLHPEQAMIDQELIDPSTKAVCVNLARAGTYPPHICYEMLNYILDPNQVRQDHFSIARQTGENEKVTGSHISGHKVGGPIDGSILLIPDPMAATGSSISQTLKEYEKFGKPRKTVVMHCIVTPEYLKKVKSEYPDLLVYAIRLDRGLSDPKVLNSIPGTHWDEERGLNDQSYIVPGGGGFGEVMNNSFV